MHFTYSTESNNITISQQKYNELLAIQSKYNALIKSLYSFYQITISTAACVILYQK